MRLKRKFIGLTKIKGALIEKKNMEFIMRHHEIQILDKLNSFAHFI